MDTIIQKVSLLRILTIQKKERRFLPSLKRWVSTPSNRMKLFRLVIFNFLVGNEDMHLKNFMLIEQANKVELSPAYDLVNTTLVLASQEEIALPIRGKKNRLSRADLVD
jgi:serine/threonine protein kinase HipA of HipAB toxin-antitoxin module